MRAVLVGEYIKSHREKQGITQEEQIGRASCRERV